MWVSSCDFMRVLVRNTDSERPEITPAHGADQQRVGIVRRATLLSSSKVHDSAEHNSAPHNTRQAKMTRRRLRRRRRLRLPRSRRHCPRSSWHAHCDKPSQAG